jgi:hypothetical protein
MKLSQHITHDLSNVLADTAILVESRMGVATAIGVNVPSSGDGDTTSARWLS